MARALLLAGLGLAVVGNVGWALIIGTFAVSWTFWAFALGTLGVLAASTQGGRVRAWGSAAGWTLAAVGAARLSFAEIGRPPGNDFPAPYLYYLGFIVAGVAAVAAAATQRPKSFPRIVAVGVAAAALGGCLWTFFDVGGGTYDYTWANVSIGIGYGIAAARLWSLGASK